MGHQGFRITTLEATSDQLMAATCTHITSDLASNVIVDRAAVNRTASQATTHALASLSAPHPFTAGPATVSGIARRPGGCVKPAWKPSSMTRSGCSRGGVEIIRDNTRITWVSAWKGPRGERVGRQKPHRPHRRDTTGLATRILPVGLAGWPCRKSSSTHPASLSIPHPYIRVVSFDQIKAAGSGQPR